MVKKTGFVLMVLMAVITRSSAQSDLQDVVYLKDGSILRGNIVAQFLDSLVKIEISGGSVFAVKMEQLQYIEYKVKPPKSEVPVTVDTPFERKEHGYFNITDIGVLPGTNYTYDYYYGSNYATTSIGFTIQTIHGYRFNPHFLAGAGLAIDIIQYPMGQLFADGRWEILNRKATPFVFIDAGYGIPLNKDQDDANGQVYYSGGFTAGGGVGMRVNFHNEGAFVMEVGYKMEKRSEHIVYEIWGTDQTNSYTYNRLAIRFGLAF
ncbi:MAG: hypothetical protein IPO83_18435 [Chitinophagaceae bacterium]|nr:hypothetical protein [Chitinophagaceae bacterium]